MPFKKFSWTVPLTRFQAFNSGAVVSGIVPASWGLNAGDRIEYECGQEISGVAEVVSAKRADLPALDWNAMESGEEGPPPTTAGLECEFKKIS